jgi:hypothetical protein
VATQTRHTIAQSGSASVASGVNVNLTANTPSAEIIIGKNQMVRIAPTTASVGVFIRFGVAGTNSASTSDVYVPYGMVELFDMGSNTSICFLATSTATVQYTIVPRS